MKELIINQNDAGQRLDKFLTKALPKLPKTLMYKYIRTKRIKLNGKKADIAVKLNLNDTLALYINDEFFGETTPRFEFTSAPALVNIVYEDENILLADKPQGLLVHPDNTEYCDTLVLRIQHYLYQKGEYDPQNESSFKPALVNRIDRNTGGIVIAAKTAAALRILNDKMKEREVEKFYLCVVHGYMQKKADTMTGFLEKDENKNKVFIKSRQTEETRTIKTRYKVLAEKDDLSLLQVELLTGRTHQIRAHLASIGHPLLGDGKYGKNTDDKKFGFKHQALYSYRLKFNFKTDAGELAYLNEKEFSVSDVWFAKELFNREV